MKIFITLLLTFLLAACGGREFVRPQNESFSLGSTTYDQIIKSYGEPRRTGTVTRNGIPLKGITYSYAVAVPFTTKLSSRAMVFVFENDALVSYDYVSSFDDEKNAANYDDEKVKQITKGDKKSKVLGILGKPGGESIYPVASPKGNSILRYSFMDTYRVPFLPMPRITRKVLTILFDSNDTVIDISSVESKPD
jgi:hypothetical protein